MEKRMITADKIVKLLAEVKMYDDDSLTKMLNLLLSDELFMLTFNELRKNKGLKAIDFEGVKTVNELKEAKYDITFEQLLECMSSINLDNNEPINDTLYGKNYHE
jgi:hypothetical protein